MSELMPLDEAAMVDLAVQQQPELVLPWSGELVDLRDPNQAAMALDGLREHSRRLRDLRDLLEAVLRLEALRQGTKTLHLDGCDAVVSGGQRVDYDGEQLARLLEQAGMPPERVGEIVQVVVSWKVNAAKAKQAAAANPAYFAAVEETKTVVETPWRVSVKRP